jgi:hypothetical protein
MDEAIEQFHWNQFKDGRWTRHCSSSAHAHPFWQRMELDIVAAVGGIS